MLAPAGSGWLQSCPDEDSGHPQPWHPHPAAAAGHLSSTGAGTFLSSCRSRGSRDYPPNPKGLWKCSLWKADSSAGTGLHLFHGYETSKSPMDFMLETPKVSLLPFPPPCHRLKSFLSHQEEVIPLGTPSCGSVDLLTVAVTPPRFPQASFPSLFSKLSARCLT